MDYPQAVIYYRMIISIGSVWNCKIEIFFIFHRPHNSLFLNYDHVILDRSPSPAWGPGTGLRKRVRTRKERSNHTSWSTHQKYL